MHVPKIHCKRYGYINRVIPSLIVGASAGLTDTIEKQLTGDKLDQAIIDICTAYNYGWEVYVYNKTMVFIVYFAFLLK